MKDQTKLLQEKILHLKKQIIALGPMRPGKLSIQYQRPQKKEKPYYQISYTLNKRSHTDYVRKDDIETVKQQLENYQTFKKICEEIVQASIELIKNKNN